MKITIVLRVKRSREGLELQGGFGAAGRVKQGTEQNRRIDNGVGTVATSKALRCWRAQKSKNFSGIFFIRFVSPER